MLKRSARLRVPLLLNSLDVRGYLMSFEYGLQLGSGAAGWGQHSWRVMSKRIKFWCVAALWFHSRRPETVQPATIENPVPREALNAPTARIDAVPPERFL